MHKDIVKKIISELVSFSLEKKASEVKIKLEDIDNCIKIELYNNISKVTVDLLKEFQEKLNISNLFKINDFNYELNDNTKLRDQINIFGTIPIENSPSLNNNKNIKIILYKSKEQLNL